MGVLVWGVWILLAGKWGRKHWGKQNRYKGSNLETREVAALRSPPGYSSFGVHLAKSDAVV